MVRTGWALCWKTIGVSDLFHWKTEVATALAAINWPNAWAELKAVPHRFETVPIPKISKACCNAKLLPTGGIETGACNRLGRFDAGHIAFNSLAMCEENPAGTNVCHLGFSGRRMSLIPSRRSRAAARWHSYRDVKGLICLSGYGQLKKATGG